MFSVQQKRDIANAVQKILRDTGHPELPVGEIQFKLYVHGRYQWSWVDIQNNGAVSVPSVNPWNESQDKATPAESRYGRDMKPKEPEHGTFVCEIPNKAKPEWVCSRCGHRNVANNEVCMGAEMGDGRCGKPKPECETCETCGNCNHFKLVSKHGDEASLNCEIVGYGTKADNNPCDRFKSKPKPLAQYLMEYIEHEIEDNNIDSDAGSDALYLWPTWRELLEQALDAYQSTENVTIKIERK